MKIGAPALISYLVLAATSSWEGSGGRTGGEGATVRALDRRWRFEECIFADREALPYGDMVFTRRSYGSVGFQKIITVDDRSFDNAHALLLELGRKKRKLASLLSKTTPSLHQKKFYSIYNYEESGPETEDKEAGGTDGRLLIPRYIRASASVHRLAIVNILGCRDPSGAVYDFLQLSYEDVPGQCRCSPLFKQSQWEVVDERYKKNGGNLKYNCRRCGDTQVPDSDGDQNAVRVSVATTLSQWLGEGFCAEVGRGGYSTSHEGMVHAFVRLTHESARLVKRFMKMNALGADEDALGSGRGKEFVRTEMDTPFLTILRDDFLTSGKFSPGFKFLNGRTYRTYRAIVSNHRQRSEQTSSDRLGAEMTLLPIRNGVFAFGILEHYYCVASPYVAAEKHTKNMILYYSSETGSTRVMDSQRHRALLRHRAAFTELMLDVDAANAAELAWVERLRAELARSRRSRAEAAHAAEVARAEATRAAELARAEQLRTERDAASSKFMDDAAEKMLDAEEKVKEGLMGEAEYLKLCNDLKDEYHRRFAARSTHYR